MAKRESLEVDSSGQGQPNGPTTQADIGAQQSDDPNTESLNNQPATLVLSELDREFQRAKDNPSDFNQWVAVEKLLDKEVQFLAKTSSISKSAHTYIML